MQKLKQILENRRAEGTIRSLSLLSVPHDFYSNDYLGFSQNPIPNKGKNVGVGSRLISGNTSQAMQLEEKIALHFQSKKALIFNSGYSANLGFFGSVPQRGDTVIYDHEIHASIRDGIRLSHAKSFAFKHNDLVDLDKKCEQAEGEIYVAVESLYSMSGTFGDLVNILTICEKHGAHLVVDEAHAGGIYGKKGEGLCVALGISDRVFARVVTFGKAYGAHGAAVLSNATIIEYLVNFARPFIYTTALPNDLYFFIEEQLFNPGWGNARNQLLDNLVAFRKNIIEPSKFTCNSAVNSPIQTLTIGDITQTRALAINLQNAGIAIKPIFSPTVEKGKEGIRFCIHSFNSLASMEIIQKELQNG